MEIKEKIQFWVNCYSISFQGLDADNNPQETAGESWKFDPSFVFVD